MQQLIQEKLREIEAQENIRILHAVESGSRAWGFPSPDSDYDVRFLYVRSPEFYLKLEKTRDVVELPINDMLDVNGWDLKKALQLLYTSNPTLFEWMASPIVYRTTDFPAILQPYLRDYFSPQKSLYHYVHTAQRNYRDFLTGETVKAKKYFYVLRPLLACKWILERRTPPPMLFSDLVETQLEEALKGEVQRLLDIKINVPELKTVLRVDVLNRYLEENIRKTQEIIPTLPQPQNPGWEPLNELFRQILQA